MSVTQLGVKNVADNKKVAAYAIQNAAADGPAQTLVIPQFGFFLGTGFRYQVSLKDIPKVYKFGQVKRIRWNVIFTRGWIDQASNGYSPGKVYLISDSSQEAICISTRNVITVPAATGGVLVNISESIFGIDDFSLPDDATLEIVMENDTTLLAGVATVIAPPTKVFLDLYNF